MAKVSIELPNSFTVAMRQTSGETETFQVDAASLSDPAIIHCLTNGIQRFCNDAANSIAAQAADEEDKDAIKREVIADKIAKLTAETFTVGARGASVDIWTREARNVLMDNAQVKAKVKDLKAAERNELLDQLIEKNKDGLTPIVDERVKALQKSTKVSIEL